MKNWHFGAALLFCILLLAGGISLAAQRLGELQGERVELHLLPDPVQEVALRVVGAARDFSHLRHQVAEIKDEVLNTFIKGH